MPAPTKNTNARKNKINRQMWSQRLPVNIIEIIKEQAKKNNVSQADYVSSVIIRDITVFSNMPSRKKPPQEKSPLTLTFPELLENNQGALAKRKRRETEDITGRSVVYVIRKNNQVMYIGQTRSGVRERIRRHITGKSEIGIAIKADKDVSQWSVEIIPASSYKELLALEKKLITELSPQNND